jgi:hypothetical protein
MFAWLSKFTTSGNRLSKATAALADTFEQLNEMVREQTGLARLDAKASRKPRGEVIEHKATDATSGAA